MAHALVQSVVPSTGVAYPVSRLVYTLLFMALVVGVAMVTVRRTSNRLLGEIATTLGFFLLVIGTIVYTVAFRGLRLSEMVVSWAISGFAIFWFVRRMHAITATESTQERNAAVNASEARFRSIIENAEEGLSIVAFDGNRRYVSPATARMLGFEVSELEGSSALDIIHPDDAKRYWEMFVDVRSVLGRTREEEFTYVCKDKSTRVLAATAKNLSDVPGVEGVVLNLRDVTAQRHLELQLQQAQKMESVGQLAGGVAHDFNNILTAITGRTEFLSAATNLNQDQREDVDEIRRAAERAASLTRQLLAFSRKQLLVPRVLNLNQVVRETVPMLRRLIGEDVRIHTIILADAVAIVADRGQIEQVLLNLALNARDAMPAGGLLTIETAIEGPAAGSAEDFVVLRISDTGHGMDEATKLHIFEPFFTTKPVGKGTGLGLSTVYGIVKQSEATIEVDSSVGRGTTFRIHFPRTGELVPSPSLDTGNRMKRGTERVLLVEDDDSVRQVAERVLGGNGFVVTSALSGAAALELFEGSPDDFDLVLTDLVMPGMSGRELMQKLRLVRPAVRVMFMSGYTDDDILRRGLHDPGVWFLQKPFTSDEMLSMVRHVLDDAPGRSPAPALAKSAMR